MVLLAALQFYFVSQSSRRSTLTFGVKFLFKMKLAHQIFYVDNGVGARYLGISLPFAF